MNQASARGATGPAAYKAKLKRLLDLVVLLLDAREPLTFEEIRDQFPEYRTAKRHAGKRTFERDKNDLLELGVPLEWIPPEGADDDDDEAGDGEGGYTIRRRAFALPPIDLGPAEAALIYLAAGAARSGVALPYLDSATLALRKIAFDLPPASQGLRPPILVNLPTEGSNDPHVVRHLETLQEAVGSHRRLALVYRAAPPPLPPRGQPSVASSTTERDFDPYGLFYREGAWVAIGHCHLRKEVRTFRVDRIVSLHVTSSAKGADFSVPADFSLAMHGTRSPWRFDNGSPVDVALAISPAVRFVGEEDFGPDARRERSAGGETTIAFSCKNLGYLRERVLAATGALRVVAPMWLRDELATEMERTLARYPEIER